MVSEPCGYVAGLGQIKTKNNYSVNQRSAKFLRIVRRGGARVQSDNRLGFGSTGRG